MTYVEQRGETQRLNTILDELERASQIIKARCVPMSEEILDCIERCRKLETEEPGQ